MPYFIGTGGNQAANYDALFDSIRFKLTHDTATSSGNDPWGNAYVNPDGQNGIMGVGDEWEEVHYVINADGTQKRTVLHSHGVSGNEVIYLYIASYSDGASKHGLKFMSGCFYDSQFGLALPNQSSASNALTALINPCGSIERGSMGPSTARIPSMGLLNTPFDYWLIADKKRMMLATLNAAGITNMTCMYSGQYTRYTPPSHNPNPMVCFSGYFSTDAIGNLPANSTSHSHIPYMGANDYRGSSMDPDNVRRWFGNWGGSRPYTSFYTYQPPSNYDNTYTLIPHLISYWAPEDSGRLFLGELDGYYCLASEDQDSGSYIAGGDTINISGTDYIVIQNYQSQSQVVALKLA